MAFTQSELGDLLGAVAKGDQSAFRKLYDQTSAKLFGVVLRLLRDRSAASEVLQEAYLRAWQNAARFDAESGRPMTWLIAIARHAAIDELRRRESRRFASGPDGEEAMAALAAPETTGQDVLARDRLAACLGQLDPQHRRCVVLAYCSGYSRDELAAATGRPVGTIKTWLHRSLLALRQCLEGS